YTKAIGATETKKWVAIDIPITDFATGNNSQRGELAQFLITVAGLIDVAYIDNIYFYDDGTGGNNGGGSNGGGGEAAAPTDAPTAPPVRNAANVISIYGEAYGAATGLSNVPWDGSTAFAEETIAGNKVLKVNFDTFLGTSLDSKVDASGMSHFHMEYTKAIGATETKKWVAIDIPITDFATGDNSQRGELAQFLITVAGKIDVAYIDNIYFYNAN
ncbi:MAG: hypothetical protein GDA37_09275, partial [Ekhidna sp.]|nr:hypothetical protein [Ekhidna sp.]